MPYHFLSETFPAELCNKIDFINKRIAATVLKAKAIAGYNISDTLIRIANQLDISQRRVF